MNDARPTPEEMLLRAAAEAERAHRGRLKVFFGASPGVGKTYAMLEAARAQRSAGVDVVIGWVETHGRRDTEALAEGLERIPPRAVEYRGITLRDFDLDAALARRPGLLLLDELAHTNAPGLRHLKRWQDVEELLDAGVTIYTTLNVQHLESVNDLVARSTGVDVRETVPDSVLDRADELELVDLPPDDLLQRLRDGKVYVPQQAERAMQRFFRKENLIALRELALRRTADRVDLEASAYRREQGMPAAPVLRERVLVAVGPAPQAADLIRAGLRIATGLKAGWIVASVEGPDFDRLPRADRDRIGDHLTLAERLGAGTVVVRGVDVAAELLALARQGHVTRIVVGKPTHPRWRDRLRGSLVDRLVRGSGEIDVIVTTGVTAESPAPARAASAYEPVPWAQYLIAAASVGAVTLGLSALRAVFTVTDQAMLYLLGTLLAARSLRRGPSLATALLSVAVFDFFFVPPFYTFAVSDVRYTITFAVLLVVGVLVSTLTHQFRQQAVTARERERRTAALYALSRDLVVETSAEQVARAVLAHVRELLGTEAQLLLAKSSGGLAPPIGGTVDDRERAVADWAFVHRRPAGRGTDTLPASEGLYLPLVGTQRPLGVLCVQMARLGGELTPSRQQLLETYVAQAALALERVSLAEEAAQAAVAAETERTRSALLSAISHDVRTPLTSIAGAASTLLYEGGGLTEGQRRELLETVADEAERLARLVGDLLNLTRLETGALTAHKEPVPVEEVVVSALGRMERRLVGREVRTDLPSLVLVVPLDPVLMEQVVVELLENAVKYSPPGSPIDVAARRAGSELLLEVADRGAGVPAGEEERVFDRFFRGSESRAAAGTGLGLTVCRAIVRAHGGTIALLARSGGGTVARVAIPAEADDTPADAGSPA